MVSVYIKPFCKCLLQNHPYKDREKCIWTPSPAEVEFLAVGREKESEVKVAQSCPTLCNPMDYTVHGILQARILEWVAFPFSRGSSQPKDRIQVSFIAGRFIPSWATREAQEKRIPRLNAAGKISLIIQDNSICNCFPCLLSSKGLPVV